MTGFPMQKRWKFPLFPSRASTWVTSLSCHPACSIIICLSNREAIDSSDNSVFYIGRLISTGNHGADARTILQVPENAKHKRWRLIIFSQGESPSGEQHETMTQNYYDLLAFHSKCMHAATQTSKGDGTLPENPERLYACMHACMHSKLDLLKL